MTPAEETADAFVEKLRAVIREEAAGAAAPLAQTVRTLSDSFSAHAHGEQQDRARIEAELSELRRAFAGVVTTRAIVPAASVVLCLVALIVSIVALSHTNVANAAQRQPPVLIVGEPR